MASVLQNINQLWLKHSDVNMKRFPLLDSPLKIVLGVIISVAIIQVFKILKPFLRANKSSAQSVNNGVNNGNSKSVKLSTSSTTKDIRPILLILDGFCFGCYGIAVFLITAVADFGRMFYTCNYPHHISDFHVQAITHLIYVYLLISFVCYGHPLIQVLGGHPVDVLVDIVHHSIWTCLVFFYLSVNPVGLSLVIAVIDSITKSVHYGSQVLAVSEKDSMVAVKWNNFFRALMFGITAVHSYYFNVYSSSCSRPSTGSAYEPILLTITCLYASTVTVISATRLLVSVASSFSASSIEKQVLSSGQTLRKNVRLTKIPVTMMK